MQLDTKTLVDKLNEPCRKALEAAAHLALARAHYTVDIEHYLLKLFELPDTDLVVVARQYDVKTDRAVKELARAVERQEKGNGRTPSLSPMINDLLQEAWVQASSVLGAPFIRSGAILQAVLDNAEIVAALERKAPTVAKIYRERLRADLPDLIELSKEEMPAVTALPAMNGTSADELPASSAAETLLGAGRDRSALGLFTVSLTEQAATGLIDPIVGRDAEIRQVIDILMRRRQNNPILTGAAGVGKTAVVEGFAQRVAAGDVPPALANVDVRMLDLGLLQAGAGIQGAFEERVKNVIAEVQASPRPVVLFIDEAHALIGAGGNAGSGDAANLLKPALARGELRTIAATTWAEYKKYVEADPALARRFQVIPVAEPDEETAVAMLRGLALRLEEHHKVPIRDEALRAAVRLSARYITGRQLPDKAVGVLDTACARVAVVQNAQPAALEEAARRAERLTAEIEMLRREAAEGDTSAGARIAWLETEIAAVSAERDDLAARWEQERGLVASIRKLQTGVGTPEADYTLKEMQAKLAALQGDAPMVPVAVDAEAVARVVAAWTGIPVGRMMRDDIDALLHLEQRLGERIVGQSPAVAAVAGRLRTYRAHLGAPGKPVGVFLFAGPSGVGKTETALALADFLYGGGTGLIALNMSEYQEAHTVSKLKGAPPGYVGYGRGGVLTEAVRRNPYALVLLDEVEKAHPDVLELFYQVFDKGILEDAEGERVDFRNTVIVMTSNLGGAEIAEAAKTAKSNGHRLEALVEAARPALMQHFQPAFLSRLTVVPFMPLDEADIRAVVALKLNEVQMRYEETYGATLSVAKSVADAIAARCREVDSGARNIDQIVTQSLLPQLSEQILARMADAPVGAARLTMAKDGGFRFDFAG
jgi:type VI secretion system protein VasG